MNIINIIISLRGFRSDTIYNKLYNPNGKSKADDFVFPYRSNSFNMVFLTSVFTHMYADDVTNYLKEIYRVLKIGGKCFFTCWLINDESLRLMKVGESGLNFDIKLNNCFTTDKSIPENAIAFDEYWLDNQIKNNNFTIQLKRYGYWCGRDIYTSYQDIVIAKKCG